MYCQHCGVAVENARFCPSCGGKQGSLEQTESLYTNQLVGYSDKINDPRIAAVMKKMNSSGTIFTFILAVVAVIGFTVAGAAEAGDFELPSAFFIGLGIGGLLVVIAFVQKARRKKDKTWDGVVVDKKVKQPSYSDRQQGHYQTKYSVHIRLENGKTKIMQYTEELFNYYQIGDHVRHHAGTASHILEKYDKSHDTIIYCIACTSKNDINNDICHRCKSPLLK